MIVDDKKIEKICNFYVSDFHLEMILLPYISEKIKKNEQVMIATQKNLEETIKELVGKVNLDDEMDKKILDLEWNSTKLKKVEDNANIILIGTEKFIKNQWADITEKDFNNIKIIDCYNFNEVKDDMQNIISVHDKTLNTLGMTSNPK